MTRCRAQCAAMYELLVIAHSWFRWVVLVSGIIAFARAVAGRFERRSWSPADDTASRLFVISVDIQVLVGLVLYLFLSPYTMSAWRDIGGAMGDAVVRFWAVEHVVGMLAATAFAHVGRVRIRKTTDATRKHFMAAMFFGLALVLMLVSMAWPFTTVSRPLLRM